jgi:hypothetical protein
MTLVAATPSIVTEDVARRFVPVMVTVVPPVATPVVGEIDAIVGGSS